MSVSNIIAKSRRLAGVDSNQYSDSAAIQDFNEVYHEIEDAIVAEQEDYFWDYVKTNSVTGQSEYLIPQVFYSGGVVDTNWETTNKVVSVSIKYNSSDTEYTKARLVDINSLDRDYLWYETNQPQSDPIFHISDNSYFIYPAPTSDITNAVKTTVIKGLRDVTISDTSNTLFNGKIPKKYHTIISFGLIEYIHRQNGDINASIEARNNFDIELEKLIDRIKTRYEEPLISEMPNINHLG